MKRVGQCIISKYILISTVRLEKCSLPYVPSHPPSHTLIPPTHPPMHTHTVLRTWLFFCQVGWKEFSFKFSTVEELLDHKPLIGGESGMSRVHLVISMYGKFVLMCPLWVSTFPLRQFPLSQFPLCQIPTCLFQLSQFFVNSNLSFVLKNLSFVFKNSCW